MFSSLLVGVVAASAATGVSHAASPEPRRPVAAPILCGNAPIISEIADIFVAIPHRIGTDIDFLENLGFPVHLDESAAAMHQQRRLEYCVTIEIDLYAAMERKLIDALDGSGLGILYDTDITIVSTIEYNDGNGEIGEIDVESSAEAADWTGKCGYAVDSECIVFKSDKMTLYAPTSSGDLAKLVVCGLPDVLALGEGGSLVDISSCVQSTATCSNMGGVSSLSVHGDPHVTGLLGQTFDWSGEDGGWYAFLSDDELQMNLRVTSYLPETFPDRQLVTGVALITEGGHSVTIEVVDPLNLEPSCDVGELCLANGALRVTVDGEDVMQHPGSFNFGGDVEITAVNLPLECQRFGDHNSWMSMTEEQKLASPERRRLRASSPSMIHWLLEDTVMIAPPWCEKYLMELNHDMTRLEQLNSEHAVFRVESPNLSVRVNVGINSETEQALPDGRVVPESTFWQMDVRVQNAGEMRNAKGMLGETARPVLDAEGNPVMSGLGVLRGGIENYRVVHPLGTEFKQRFVPEE